MRGLWKKEIRGLRPFIILILFLLAFAVILDFVTTPPDQTDLADWLSLRTPDDQYLESALLFLITFVMASGLLVREHDEGTQEFLDSLPVNRSQSFLVKAVTAFGVLTVFPLLTLVGGLLFYALTVTSLSPPLPVRLLLTLAVIELAEIYVFLSVGLLLSFLRRFAWVLLPLLYFSYTAVHRHHPSLQYLNPFSLMEPIIAGNSTIFPFKHLGVQLLLGSTCLGLAWAMYVHFSDGMHRFQQRLARNGGGRFLLLVAGLAIAGLWSFVFYQTTISKLGDTDDAVTQTDAWRQQDWQVSQISTDNLIFTCKGYQVGQAEFLAAVADSLNQQVRDFLGAELNPSPIVVDLTAQIPHLAGVAHWHKIQVDLRSCRGPSDRVAVLGHEMVHVCIAELSDSYLGRHFPSTQFFHEGLATYLEYRLFRGPEELAMSRFVAAATYHRCGFRLKQLVNSQELRRMLNRDLVYNMGEVFVSALVKTYGDEAPGKVLRAFGRKEAPDDLRGVALWRDGMQAAGYSFDAVVGVFFAQLDSLVVANAEFLDDLPRLHADTSLDADGFFHVKCVGAPARVGWVGICRFRQSIGDDDIDLVELDSGGASVDGDYFLGGRAWYQLGWFNIRNPRAVIYEKWESVALR